MGEEYLRERISSIPEEERPLWLPEEQIPFETMGSSRAVSRAGLKRSPALDTARDTLPWLLSRQQGAGLETGFSPEFERELLGSWHAGSVDARSESG